MFRVAAYGVRYCLIEDASVYIMFYGNGNSLEWHKRRLYVLLINMGDFFFSPDGKSTI